MESPFLGIPFLFVMILLVHFVNVNARQCARIQRPRANYQYELVHVDTFEEIDHQAKTLCTQRNISHIRCNNVVRELRTTLLEMIKFEANEAVVNVTFDYTLAYNFEFENSSTQEFKCKNEPLIVYPEEPVEKTVTKYCLNHGISETMCIRTLEMTKQLVARDWGCLDEDDHEHDQEHDQEEDGETNSTPRQETSINIPILLDGKEQILTIQATQDPVFTTALFCHDKLLIPTDCVSLIHMAQNYSDELPAFQAFALQNVMLNLTSPLPTRLYPVSQRIYIERNWTELGKQRNFSELCIFLDNNNISAACLDANYPGPIYFNAFTLPLGSHALYFASQRLQIATSTTTQERNRYFLGTGAVMVVDPTVELLGIDTGMHNGKSFLNAKIKTTHFDIFDPAYRVCILHNDDFECLEPRELWIEEASDRSEYDRTIAGASALTVFRAPIFNASNGTHEVTVLLLTENNKCFAFSNPFHFNVGTRITVLPLPSIPKFFHNLEQWTPQRPSHCPEALVKRELSWICSLWRHEWGLYSQNGEDGILKSIFYHIGVQHKYYVEFGTEDGSECNSRYWREQYNWTGLLMDGSHSNATINLHQEWVFAENIMALLHKYQVPPNVDLLSIDVDFNDYWILHALELDYFSPRVIVIEYNSHIAPTEARVVSYNTTGFWDGKTDYFGASVGAYYHWAVRHNYSLLYCESHGVNCFLTRNDVLGFNVSAHLRPEDIYAPPNFFGRGWTYPHIPPDPLHQWTWLV